MSFSDFKFFPVNGNSVVKANGSFVYNGAVRISCTIINGKNGLFVSLPREKYKDKKTGEDKYADKVFFTEQATRDELQKVVIAAYNGGSTTSAGSQGASPEPASQVPAKKNLPF